MPGVPPKPPNPVPVLLLVVPPKPPEPKPPKLDMVMMVVEWMADRGLLNG